MEGWIPRPFPIKCGSSNRHYPYPRYLMLPTAPMGRERHEPPH
uniref:Uncharacterized protein n=1 Tax=Picea sitchensis TaxID=3332 RepID=A0A6B9XVK8_PICSI|nr:hypothetical protein Q903MT_gene4374 [Picea sitchensis]